MGRKTEEKGSKSSQAGRSDPVHGNIYQLKLLMLFLHRGIQQRYSFRVGTEVNEAKKFDDLVFEYTQENEKIFRLLQAKHRKDEKYTCNKITVNDLFSEKGGDFSLPKYFHSYQDLKNEKFFRGGKIKDVIICTNIDFNILDLEKSNISIVEITDIDNILHFNTIHSSKQPARFKICKSNVPMLKQKLENYELTKLANMLIDCILTNEIICSQRYHLALAEDVINVEDKKIKDTFITNVNLSSTAERFRDIFENELRNKTEEKLRLEKLNDAIEDESILNRKISIQLSKKFGQSKNPNKSWPKSEICDEDIEDFLNDLVFAVNQPNEEELGNIIKEEISQEYSFITTKYIYYEIFHSMLELMQGKKGNRFITYEEGIKLLKDTENEMIFLIPALQYEHELRSVPYLFKQRYELQNFISSDKNLWLICSKTPWLNSLVIYQNIPKLFKYIFVPLNVLQDIYEKTNCIKIVDLLIICHTSVEKDHMKIIKGFQVINDIINESKRVIFITFENKEFLEQMELATFPHFDESITITLSDLTKESQIRILEEERIYFQRNKRKQSLKQLLCLTEGASEVMEKFNLDYCALDILLKNSSSSIDLLTKRPWFSDLEEAHYKPKIQELEAEQVQQTILSYPSDVFAFRGNEYDVKQLLKDRQHTLYTFRGMTSEFSSNIPGFVYLQTPTEFKQLCKLLDEYSDNQRPEAKFPVLHFLNQVENKWKWKETYDKNIYIQRKIRSKKNQNNRILSEADLTKDEHRLIILAGKHGSGKSFTLTRIAELLKKENPSSLVMKVDLKQHQKLFESNSWRTMPELIELLLLSDEASERNPLMQSILIHKLQLPGQVYTLWDHLDELDTEVRSKVLDLFEFLAKNTKSAIWIAMRRTEMKILRNKLSTMLYTFDILNEENQLEFVTKYWKNIFKFTHKTSDQSFTNLLHNHAKKVIEEFQKEVGIKNILNMPLNLRLFAETHAEKREIRISGRNTCPEDFPFSTEKLLTVNIYSSLVDKHFNIFLEATAKKLDTESRDYLKKIYAKKYGALALKKVCRDTQEYVNNLLKKNTVSLENISRIGLVDGDEERFNFMHRTFEEYFAVQDVSRKLLRIPTAKPVWDLLLNDVMMKKHCRKFFNDKLIIDSKLSNLVSERDQKEIVYGIIHDQVNCSRSILWEVAVDNLERTLVFLAKCAQDFDSLKKISVPILKKSICPREGCSKLIETFFEYGNELDSNRINEFIVNETYNLFLTAARKNDCKTLDILINHIKDGHQILQIVKSCSPSGKTALHFAAKVLNFNVIEKCIEKLNESQRQIVFNTPDVFNELPYHYIPKHMTEKKLLFEQYMWDVKQKPVKERKNYRIFSKNFSRSVKNNLSHSNIRKSNVGLYLPTFENRKTAIHGSAITRAFSQFLFFVGVQEAVGIMEIVKKFYVGHRWRYRRVKFRSILAPKELCSLLYLLIHFAEHLDFDDKSLPSELVIHSDFKTLPYLHDYIKDIKNDASFAIHLIANNHVSVVYRVEGYYGYFDSNSVCISGLRTIDEVISVLGKAVAFSFYQVCQEGFFIEDFDVEKANNTLSTECKEAVKTFQSWKKSVLGHRLESEKGKELPRFKNSRTKDSLKILSK